MKLLSLLLFCGTLSAATPVSLSVATAPGQLQFFLNSPQTLISGGAVVDLDPTVFGDIQAADAFSATGDQIGTANIQGRHLDIEFASMTGGLGRLPGLPVFSITVPILAAVSTSSITLRPGRKSWIDLQGFMYPPGALVAAGSVTFIPVLHGNFTALQPIFPSELYPAGFAGSFVVTPATIALQNPRTDTVHVIIQSFSPFAATPLIIRTPATLPPGSTYQVSSSDVGGNATIRAAVSIYPDAPIRMAVVSPTFFSAVSPTTVLTTSVSVYPGQALVFNSPGSQVVSVIGNGLATPFTVTASPDWLSVSPSSGTACLSPPPFARCGAPGVFTVTVDASRLSPGSYSGTVTIMPQGPNPRPTVIPVVFNLYAQPTILGDQTPFSLLTGYTGPAAYFVKITSSADPLPFTASASASSTWLSVTPTSGQTPATLAIKLDPALLKGALDNGTVTVKGPNNSLMIPISFGTFTPPIFQVTPSPAFLQFAMAGTQVINVSPVYDPFTISLRTDSPVAWLSAVIHESPGVPSIMVTVNPAGLAPGTYRGSVTITSATPAFPAVVPVTLYVLAGPPPPATLSATSLSYTAEHGTGAPAQYVNTATGEIPLPFSISTSTTDGARWLNASANAPYTPGPVTVTADATSLAPGTYTGRVTINGASIQVTFAVTPAGQPSSQVGIVPLITQVVNAASQLAGSLAPLEIITILGQGLNGPVTFDGIPAPVLYASPIQVNAIVPYTVIGTTIANINIGTASAQVPLTGAAPGVFTLAQDGVGAAVVLNQDRSVNSASNPAARGSTIQIFVTGQGISGQPLKVSIGGLDATVVDPKAMTVVVPTNVAAGSAIPIVVSAGTAASQGNVTIALK